MPSIRSCLVSGALAAVWASVAAAEQPWEHRVAAPVVRIFVAPGGDDTGPGSAARPFRTLERAQRAVRDANAGADVIVTLADGTYALDRPLAFGVADGGQQGHQVTWAAAEGAAPVISGGRAVTGWTLHDAKRGIYVATVPAGNDARQLFVNDQLAPRAGIEIARAAVAFGREGLTIDDRNVDLAALAGQSRIEVVGTGFFTNRYSPVRSVRGKVLVMQQPAWDNNLWGYDTVAKPVSPETSHLFLANSLAFLQAPGQWFLDADAGKLYLKPPVGASMSTLKVDLPRLQYLVSIGGTAHAPVRDLTFRGIRFSYTSWLGPSSAEGYANQQSGAFLTGKTEGYPADPVGMCSWGCRAFETRRNDWSQIPAAVQVSAAERITFDRDVFAHLGQIGIGIGNDDATHATGIGLGTRSISVTRSVFTDLAAGAIQAGGVSRAAHHPTQAWQANRNLLVENNRIRWVSQEYKDNGAILSTYVDSALILHNDISDVPYDAISIGWGWGLNDVGGNPIYRTPERGYYDHPANLIYDTPTTHRNVIVAYNRIRRAKTLFEDGGAIYNLSAAPGSVIAENYISDIPGKIALYLDEGSKEITVRGNVVDGAGVWLNDNTVRDRHPLRTTYANRAAGNWHNTDKVGGVWDAYTDNLILDDHPVAKGAPWPDDARRVMAAAGIEPTADIITYGAVANQ